MSNTIPTPSGFAEVLALWTEDARVGLAAWGLFLPPRTSATAILGLISEHEQYLDGLPSGKTPAQLSAYRDQAEQLWGASKLIVSRIVMIEHSLQAQDIERALLAALDAGAAHATLLLANDDSAHAASAKHEHEAASGALGGRKPKPGRLERAKELREVDPSATAWLVAEQIAEETGDTPSSVYRSIKRLWTQLTQPGAW